MLSPLRAGHRGPTVRVSTIPAPVGGWDAVSPLANMKPDHAVALDNIIPREGYCELRAGCAQHAATGETAGVETLMPYHAPNRVNDKLFAAVNGKVFNVTPSGSAGAASITGLSNARLQHTMFTTSGGQYLYFVNGANAPRYFDGSTWATPTITGATASDFVAVASFKNRLFFAANNKLGFYYLPVDQIAGAASYFELGAVFSDGGYLMAIGTWTIDGGQGVDDYAAFVSSQGQVAIYKGTDPSDASHWALVGVFNTGIPIGRRCIEKAGADLVLVTVEGVLPLSKTLNVDRASLSSAAISSAINPVLNKSARSYGDNFGWQILAYPKGRVAILNVPIKEGQTQHQYVMNTTTGAWCRFTGWNANCFGVFNGSLYFGGKAGKVYLADAGADDDGAAIIADLETAFNYFGDHGTNKRFPMVQAVITSNGRAAPAIRINTDFERSAPTLAGALTASGDARWGSAVWGVSTWPVSERVTSEWVSTPAIGRCASVRMRIVATSSGANQIVLRLNSINITVERGGIL